MSLVYHENLLFDNDLLTYQAKIYFQIMENVDVLYLLRFYREGGYF